MESEAEVLADEYNGRNSARFAGGRCSGPTALFAVGTVDFQKTATMEVQMNLAAYMNELLALLSVCAVILALKR